MKFSVKRNIENMTFSTVVKFEEFGGETLSAQDEEDMLKALGAPVVDWGGEEWVGYFKSGIPTPEGKRHVEMHEELNPEEPPAEYDEIKLIFNKKDYTVDQSFTASYYVDASKLPAVDGSSKLIARTDVAVAYCMLFEAIVKNKIKEALEKLEDKRVDFDDYEFTKPLS